MRALAPWLVIAAIALLGGMTWVYFRNQLVTSGREIKSLEGQIAALETDIEALRPKIAQLSSRTALQARLDEGFIKMIPIAQDRILRVTDTRNSGIRTVSNEGVNR